MSASDDQQRGQGSRIQDNVKVAEGLGGSNVRGIDDSRAGSDLPSGNQPRPTDPDWVHRKDPDSLPKHLPGTGQDVGFDPANMTVTSLADTTGSGASGSSTLMGNKAHAVRGGDPQALGVRGTDTEVGPMGAGPRVD
ncbi:hypothetical protein N2152v2_010933 [Parachlorella kessleri]